MRILLIYTVTNAEEDSHFTDHSFAGNLTRQGLMAFGRLELQLIPDIVETFHTEFACANKALMFIKIRWRLYFSTSHRGSKSAVSGAFGIWVLLFMLVFDVTPYSVQATENDERTPRFSLETEKAPLAEVLKEIEEITGYEITLVTERWADYPVTIRLNNVSVHTGIRGLLRKLSYYTIVDHQTKIEIYVTGQDETQTVTLQIDAHDLASLEPALPIDVASDFALPEEYGIEPRRLYGNDTESIPPRERDAEYLAPDEWYY